MTDDPDELAEQVRVAEMKLTAAKAQRQRWENSFIEATSARPRALANSQLRLVREKITKLDTHLRGLRDKLARHENTEEGMRHADDSPAPGQRGEGQVLIAGRQIIDGDRTYRRGQEVDPSILHTLNGPHMLRTGALFWGNVKPGPAPRAAPVVKARPVAPADPVVQFAWAVQRIVDSEHCDWSVAEARADNAAYLKAQKCFVDEPQMAREGAFGSGGGSLTRSGVGSNGRRIFDPEAFRARLRSIVKQGAAA